MHDHEIDSNEPAEKALTRPVRRVPGATASPRPTA